MARVDELLRVMMSRNASDLHLTSRFSPYLRVHGDIVPLSDLPVLTPKDNAEMLTEIMPDYNREAFDTNWDTDFAYELAEVGRFRVNVFRDRFGAGGVFRTIPTTPPTFEELGLPKVIRDFCFLTKGLIVVTGPTGSGKSTTLAAMMDLINRSRAEHIITIEDPIEFVHVPKRALINQREVNVHTKSFANAVRASLREDPDIVLVGEMRDLETMEAAIETAETGHLVFGTLHTNTAASTVERVIDRFPTDRQNQIRSMLADTLKGVVAQTLCRKRDGSGRLGVFEVLVVTTGVASNIREGKTYQIPSTMQTSRALGMQLLDEELLRLLREHVITPREAYMKSVEKDVFAQKMTALGYRFDVAEIQAQVFAMSEEDSQEMKERERLLNEALKAHQAAPEDPGALNNLAWIMATSSHPDVRNSLEALALAEKANQLTGGKNPEVMDTLGAALADQGQFDKAADAAKRGIKLARAMGQQEAVAVFEQRLALYGERKAIWE